MRTARTTYVIWRRLDEYGRGTEYLVLVGPRSGGELAYAVRLPPPRQHPDWEAYVPVSPDLVAIEEARDVLWYRYGGSTYTLLEGDCSERLRLERSPVRRLVAQDGRTWTLPGTPKAEAALVRVAPGGLLKQAAASLEAAVQAMREACPEDCRGEECPEGLVELEGAMEAWEALTGSDGTWEPDPGRCEWDHAAEVWAGRLDRIRRAQGIIKAGEGTS